MDTIFRSQLTLPPRTDLSIADTSNIRHFLQKICIHFTLDNVLQFRLSFLWPLSFYFLASLMTFSVLWKCRDCKFPRISSPYWSLWLTRFPVAKMPKAQWDRERNMDAIMEISFAWTTIPPLQWELVRTKETAFLSASLIVSSTRYKHSPSSDFQIII